MKNLIRGHIYQLKKDHFFFGCLALSCVFLFVSIRLSFSLASVLNPVMGIEGLFNTFLGGDTVLYVFMLLTANMVAETYRSGVMKNIIGRGIAKKQYYLSIVFTVSIVCVFGNADRRHHYGSSCGQQIWYRRNFLSWLLCSFRNSTHPFCDGAYQLCTYNDDLHQKRNYRRCFRSCDSKYPENSGNGFWVFENSD